MRKTTHWLWLVAGIFLIAGGVFAIYVPSSALWSLAWIIGLTLLLEGICSIALYAQIGWRIPGSGWYLFDGIVTVILAGFLLLNQVVTVSVLPPLLGMWIIIMGVERIMRAVDAKRMGDREWWCILILGILSVCCGIVFFLFPQISTTAIGIAIGIFLILYGCSTILLWIADHRARRFVDQMFPEIREVDARDVTDKTKKQ